MCVINQLLGALGHIKTGTLGLLLLGVNVQTSVN